MGQIFIHKCTKGIKFSYNYPIILKQMGPPSWAVYFCWCFCCCSKIGTLFLLSVYAKIECNNKRTFRGISGEFHISCDKKQAYAFNEFWFEILLYLATVTHTHTHPHTRIHKHIVQSKNVATLYVASQVNKRCAHCLIQTRNCSIALFCCSHYLWRIHFLTLFVIHKIVYIPIP